MRATIEPRALFELAFVSDPAVSADGSTAAAVVTRIEEPDAPDAPPEYQASLVAWSLETGAERTLAHPPGRYARPRFAPDGTTLAFLSDRDARAPGMQVWLLPLDGGEAKRVTAATGGVSTFAWRPDGKAIAYVARDEPPREGVPGRPREARQTYYKQDGVGWRSDTVARIHLVDTASGASTLLAEPSADPSDPTWTPDGRGLVYAAARSREAEGYYYRTLWRLEPGGEPRDLIDQPHPLIADAPAVSPDGRWVSYVAPSDPAGISSPTGVWRVPLAGGAPELVTGIDATPLVGGDARYGRYPNAPAWLDDATLLVNLNRRGSSRLCRLGLDGAVVELTDEGRAVTAFALGGGRAAFVAESPDHPGELSDLAPAAAGAGERRLSHANDAFRARYRLRAPGPERSVPSADGAAELAYWTLEPDAPREDGALVLQVHGGPRTNYGYGFSFEFQLLAARGYTVVYGNPRGGSSYGREFADAISGRLGTIDADDVLTIARDARARHAVPGAPMHLTGGSYGGFMTNWLVTRTSEFTSAVTQRSISNWLSFWGTSDIGFSWIHIETGARPWEDPMRLWDQSPMKHVASVRTPLLILHAEEDHRCPVEQAEQLFTALRALGREVAFVRYPEEGHDLSRSGRPDRRLDRLERILGWFESHPRPREGSPAEPGTATPAGSRA